MGLPGPTELLLILGVLVLLFGATKLPKLGGAIGESIKNFKKGINENQDKSLTSGSDSDSDDDKKEA